MKFHTSRSLLLFVSISALVGSVYADAVLRSPATLDPPTFVFEEIVTLGPNVVVGKTIQGGRNIVPITGGTFEGPNIKGVVLAGGWDWQLQRDDGCTWIKADYMLKTDDGVIINVLNQGVACPPGGKETLPARTAPWFEVPVGKYDWLAKRSFVGSLEGIEVNGGPAVRIRFYQVR